MLMAGVWLKALGPARKAMLLIEPAPRKPSVCLILGSVMFFFALGYGARLLAPLFARPVAWQVLDVLVGLVMWAIALGLVLHG